MKFRRTNISKLTDNQLVWLYAETGEARYTDELQFRYLPLVFGVCLNRMPDRQSASEAALAVFAALPQTLLAEIDKFTDFRSWLYGIVTAALPMKRTDGSGQNTENVRLSKAAKEYMESVACDGKEISRDMNSPAVKLTNPQRRCMKMFFEKKMTYVEIAAKAGFLATSVPIHITKGLEAIAASKQTVPGKSSKK